MLIEEKLLFFERNLDLASHIEPLRTVESQCVALVAAIRAYTRSRCLQASSIQRLEWSRPKWGGGGRRKEGEGRKEKERKWLSLKTA